MTTPSNDKFYLWGYHNPEKDPILPLSEEQKKIFERIIQTQDGEERLPLQLLPSGEALSDPSKFYTIQPNGSHISLPALYPHPDGTGNTIDRGNGYWSSGNMLAWPSPSGDQCGEDRYSLAWWDASGIYFSPGVNFDDNVCDEGSNQYYYYHYPLSNPDDKSSIVLFDDLDHDLYYASGIVAQNLDKKYLLWTPKNKNQFGFLNYGSLLKKEIELPKQWNKRKRKYTYNKEQRDYYYSHFSSANHDVIDSGFNDFQIFYTYIHYIPTLKNEFQLTHENVVLDDLNEIPFVSNPKTVYLYSVYGAGKFRDLQAQNWGSVNLWDDVYSPVGVKSDFHNVMDSPVLPFPPAERGDEESEEPEHNSEEKLQEKFDAVSGLLGF